SRHGVLATYLEGAAPPPRADEVAAGEPTANERIGREPLGEQLPGAQVPDVERRPALCGTERPRPCAQRADHERGVGPVGGREAPRGTELEREGGAPQLGAGRERSTHDELGTAGLRDGDDGARS